MSTARTLKLVHQGNDFHWVGDGFYVTQLLPGSEELRELADPFLLMDYHPVLEYPPTDTPRGVSTHPHRGFETVTLAFEGAVAHHDSTGAGGVIWPGDAQWMTAARGILHKEYHEKEWAARGGRFHMMQLWVNLPGRHKMDDPGYQGLTAESMGKVKLESGGVVTLIAGELDGVRGPAKTFTPIELWDLELGSDQVADLPIPPTHNIMVFVLTGDLTTTGGKRLEPQQLGFFEHDGDHLHLVAGETGARAIILGGEPIAEPVIFYGPFAMNTEDEIRQALRDFAGGKFGHLD